MAALSAALCLAAVACRGPAASAGAAYGTASAAAPTTMTPAAPAKDLLTVRKTGAGYVLATSTGRTIYWYSGDIKGSGKSTCVGTCLAAWPAVIGAPVAAPGVQLAGQLGTITRPGGVVQATYNGYPLYTYAQDMAPGADDRQRGHGSVARDHRRRAVPVPVQRGRGVPARRVARRERDAHRDGLRVRRLLRPPACVMRVVNRGNSSM